MNTMATDIFNIAVGADAAVSAGSGRWHIWQRGLTLIRDYPLFGIGFEGVDVRGIREYALNNRVHNEFLQYTIFYGIPAGIVYLAGTAGVYLRAIRRRTNLDPIALASLTAAFSYLVSSFFGITLFATTPFLFIFLGMGYPSSDELLSTEDG